MVGKTLGHYEILEPLGAGGMGEVYRARDGKLGRDVAVKVLPAEMARDPDQRARLVREAQLLASVNHPNIATIYSVDEVDRFFFLVLEMVGGEPLSHRLAGGALPLAVALDVAEQIAAALEAAHQRGIVHRDLKPANVMLTPESVVKVLDFGLAQPVPLASRSIASTEDPTDTSDLDVANRVAGTLAYMSPEQVRGQALDSRTDVWSFGCVFYQMLTGRQPFAEETAADVLAVILHRDPPWDALPDATPTLVRRLLQRCLHKDVAERERSMGDVRIELREASAMAERTAVLGDRMRRLEHEHDAPSLSQKPSIAVLPFADMSPAGEHEYFGDGMAEEIINALAQITDLHVVARTSAFAFKNQDKDVREIGKDLGVDLVLEGSVRSAGTRLRVTTQLINVADGYQMWSERFDAELEDVFAVQDEISRSIVQKLPLELAAGDEMMRANRSTGIVDAYTWYLKGRHQLNKRDHESIINAITCFEASIDKDSDYAPAYAGLADSHVLLGYYGALAPRSAFPRAKAAASRSLELEPELPEAHTSLAFAAVLYDRDWTAAEEGFKRALELKPGYATAHHWYSEFLAFTGRFNEAVLQADTALRLDPLSLIINTLAGWVPYYAGDYEVAIDKLNTTLQLDAGFRPAKLWLGLAYAGQSRFEDAIATLHEVVRETSLEAVHLAALGAVHALAGNTESAQKIVQKLQQAGEETYVPSYQVAAVYAQLGEIEQAFTWLDKAFEERDIWLAFLGVDPFWAPVRDHDRFAAFLERAGFA